jgi:hypothetical protein
MLGKLALMNKILIQLEDGIVIVNRLINLTLRT